MLSSLEKIAGTLIEQFPELSDCDDIETRIAVSLLLSHLVPADGKVLDCETDRLVKLIARRFGVQTVVVQKFMAMTELNRRQLISVEVLADRIKNHCGEKRLKSLIRDLWDLALCDNELHTLEEAMIYNVADNLGLRRRDVISQQTRVCA